MLNPKHSQAHKEGDMHIHDLDFNLTTMLPDRHKNYLPVALVRARSWEPNDMLCSVGLYSNTIESK